MKRLIIPILLSLTACNSEIPDESVESKPPNIIFIMTDDHAYQAISAYGSALIETPAIDRIANEGVLFDHAYVSNSICSPSRAVTLTGKFSHLNSVRDNLDIFDSTQVTFPKILQQNGYQTAVIGKWHLKSQPTGFDFWKVLPDQGHYYHPEFRTEDGIVKEEGYVTDLITDFTLDYLDSIRDEDKPFMLMYHHKAPHRQWWPDKEELENFESKNYPKPSSLYDDYANRGSAAREAEMRISDHMGLSADNKIRPENLKKEEFMDWYEGAYKERYNRLNESEKLLWDSIYNPINDEFLALDEDADLTAWKYQRYMEDYLATIKSVDRNVNRLLEYLDEKGLSENTIVIYTSDQGFYLGEHGWFDKRFMYEESFRTPLMIRWPGRIKAGSKISKMVQNIDYAPTILEMAEVKPATDMQGLSLLPLIDNPEKEWRDALYYHYYEYPGIHMVKRHYGIRTEKYKLIRFYYDVEEWELYDLEKDPSEMVNVYEDPSYSEIRDSLTLRLQEIQNQYGDSDELAQEFIQSDLARLNQ